jgi:hypothetical protein
VPISVMKLNLGDLLGIQESLNEIMVKFSEFLPSNLVTRK